MTAKPFEIDAAALHAYADNRLGADESAAVARYLETHPNEANDVAHWQRQNEALSALFAPVANEPVPSRLKPHRIAHEAKAKQAGLYRNIAAAVLLLVLGGAAGIYGRDLLTPKEGPSDMLIEAAVRAHTLYVKEKSHAVEVAADAPNLMTWLSNRIATPIDAPSLTEQGFTFMGGRLLPGYEDEGLPAPAAQLMYENASAQRVTLYITAALPDRKEAWQFETLNGVEAYYWANASVTCTVVGDLPEADLRMVGKKVFEQLTWRPDPSWNPAG